MKFEGFIQFYRSHRGGLNGALIGLAIAVAILILGFFRVLFISVFIGVGYYLGEKITDDKEYIRNMLDKVLPPGTYR